LGEAVGGGGGAWARQRHLGRRSWAATAAVRAAGVAGGGGGVGTVAMGASEGCGRHGGRWGPTGMVGGGGRRRNDGSGGGGLK
jgi:hypothetical protein